MLLVHPRLGARETNRRDVDAEDLALTAESLEETALDRHVITVTATIGAAV
jgi:hypothetical protein